MKRIIALITLVVACSVYAQSQSLSQYASEVQTFKYDTNTNGNTPIVAGVTGRRLYVYGVIVSSSSATTNSVSFMSATAGSCGGTTVVLTPVVPVVASATVTPSGYVKPTGVLPWFSTLAPGANLCLVTTAAQSLQVEIVVGIF